MRAFIPLEKGLALAVFGHIAIAVENRTPLCALGVSGERKIRSLRDAGNGGKMAEPVVAGGISGGRRPIPRVIAAVRSTIC
jgi:hypothetical protein